MRKQLIEHLKKSGINKVDLDYYLSLMRTLFNLLNLEEGQFNSIVETKLFSVVKELDLPVKQYKQEMEYVANMMVQIKHNLTSKPSKELTVMCHSCGNNSVFTGKGYRCEACGSCTGCHEGDNWPIGLVVPLSIKNQQRNILGQCKEVAKSKGITIRIVMMRIAKNLRNTPTDVAKVSDIKDHFDVMAWHRAISYVNR